MRTNSASIRQHLLLRVALAIAAAAICVSVAGVLAGRQEAGQRLGAQAAAAKSEFEQSLALRLRHAQGKAARAKALTMAAQDASVATGTTATLGGRSGGGRVYGYTVQGGRRLSVVVSTGPVAKATRSALIMALGIGAGVMLVLVSLMVAGIDRAAAAPLSRFADAIKRAQAGDAPARADENGPKEIREAATSFNALLAKVVEQRERLKAAAASDPLTGVTNNQPPPPRTS